MTGFFTDVRNFFDGEREKVLQRTYVLGKFLAMIQKRGVLLTMKPRMGFTMVELLVAFGVFSLFFGGLFLVYRTGMNMYVTGSWKMNKQKEAQRFLTILKERIEQASRPSRIDPTNVDPQIRIQVGPGDFLTALNNTDIPNIATRTSSVKIAAFSICKPDLSLIGEGAGLWFGQVLYVNKGNLELFGTSNRNHAKVSSPVGFPPSPTFNVGAVAPFTSVTPNVGRQPSEFQLGASTQSDILTDVSHVWVTWGTASGTGQADGGKIWSLNIEFRNPTHAQTTFNQGIQAKINYDVPVRPYAVGGF